VLNLLVHFATGALLTVLVQLFGTALVVAGFFILRRRWE
jgi:hypothetical protein